VSFVSRWLSIGAVAEVAGGCGPSEGVKPVFDGLVGSAHLLSFVGEAGSSGVGGLAHGMKSLFLAREREPMSLRRATTAARRVRYPGAS
jgi:hypothetical protein